MRPILLLLALCLLAGCAASTGGWVVHSVTKPPRGVANAVRSPFPLVVLGRPPDGSDAQTVAAALRLPQRQGGGGFVPTAPGNASLRIAVAFSAASLRTLCAQTGPVEAQRGHLTLSAGLCRGPKGLGYGILSAQDIAGPTDPRFEPAAGTLLREILTPQRNAGAPR